MALKIRVLGSHELKRGGAVPPWTYHADVFDESDPSKSVYTCAHNHESPQLAHGCAANWIEEAEQDPGPLPAAEQTA
jgi:hypothetical protein